MKKTLLTLFGFVLTVYSVFSQTIIAVQDFETTPAAPEWSFTKTGTGGSVLNGLNPSTGRPANAPYYFEGSSGFGVINGTTQINFDPINLLNYQNTYLNFKLASYSTTTNANGADAGDYISINFSTDGITYYEELKITGNSNSCWNFSATDTAQVTYDGISSTIQASAGGLITNGYSTVRIKLLPLVETLFIRIELKNNDLKEAWVIDKITVEGTENYNPRFITSKSQINGLNYVENNGPSSHQSYLLTGNNLDPSTGDITVNAPANFQISSNESGPFGNQLVLPYSSGSLPENTIFVRMVAGLPLGSYGGVGVNISHTGGGATEKLVRVSGIVNNGQPCGDSTTIKSIRDAIPAANSFTGGSVTLTGVITGIFGNNKFYVQDSTGGIAVFHSGIVSSNSLFLGDKVSVTGTASRFNGESEIVTVTCVSKISGGVVFDPKIFDVANPPSGKTLQQFLAENEGSFVKITGGNVLQQGTFSASTNYGVSTCQDQGNFELRVDVGAISLINSAIPGNTQDISGLVGRFISTGGLDKFQLFPRGNYDLSNSAITCVPAGGCGIASYPPTDTTFEVMNWNVEWLGNPANGPSNSGASDATQIANAISVIKSAGADLFMLQEICSYNSANPADNTTAFGKLLEGLNNHYGVNTYSGECSSAYSYAGTPTDDPLSQRVCVIYRNQTVSKLFSRPMFQNFVPASYPPTGTPSSFWASGRKPFQFMAEVNMSGKKDTVLFVGLHAKAGSDVESYNRRKLDVQYMYDSLMIEYPDQKVMILGDLNDDLDQSIYVGNISSYSPFLYVNPSETAINGLRPNANWNPISYNLSITGCASTATFSDYIDHQIISNEINTTSRGLKYLDGSISSFRPNITDYKNTTSDHYATISRFEFLIPQVTCPQNISLISTADDFANLERLVEARATGGLISGQNKITGSSRVIYTAAAIELKEGFVADNGTVFTAQTGGCN
ncbi:MAG: hypothetical protein U0V04_07820 [Spirosomataceae bacterium]